MDDEISLLIRGGSDKTETPSQKYSLADVQNMVYGQESNYGQANTSNPNYAGAHGPMQITAPTFEGLKKQGIIPKEYNIDNPEHNRLAGNALIADAYKRYGGNVDKILAEYYAGGKAVDGDTIHKEYRDLKNPNAPTVGEYIEQAKTKVGDDISRLIKGSYSADNASHKGNVTEGKPSSSHTISDFLKGTASLADVTLGSAIPTAASQVTQAVVRPFTTAEKAQEIGSQVGGALDKPFGKAFGITEEPAYKQEASQRFANFVGENIGKGADWISKQTGLPKADVENMINTLGIAVIPEGGARVKAGVSKATSAAEAALKDRFQGKQAEAAGFEQPKVPTPSEYNPTEQFVEPTFTEKGLPQEEAVKRAKILNRTAPGLKVDPNVLYGKGKERATDYAISNTDTAEGHLLAEQMAKEKAAKTAYGEQLIAETGGTKGLDESANYKRGSSVLKPLEDLSTELDNNIKELYKKRDQEAVHVPVVADEVQKVLNTKSEVLANEGTKSHAEGAKARLEELGLIDKDGKLLPANALQAEKFRQYLNDKWTPQNATLNRALKEAIDNDVFANAPEGIHNDARALYQYRKNTLDNPKGISNILDSSGPNGINRKVALERIPDTITNMPVDQFDHIIKTLDSVPDKLKPAAQVAKSEIKAHFLNKVHEQFEKSANAGTKYLNFNKEVMTRLFTPDEMAKINDYNSMAHILKTDTGYKGSAVQNVNLKKRGIGRVMFEQTVKKGGALAAEAAVGGASGGLSALATHEILSNFFEKGASKREAKAQNKAAQRKQAGFVNLSDITGK